MTATGTPTPISAEEARTLFAPLAARGHLAIAVSGGADSVALMRLLAAWAEEGPPRPRLTALTVDHGIRPEAAAEARRVAGWAAEAGLDHATLTADAEAPEHGLQAWARALRHRLLGNWVRAHGVDGVVLAHHLEDQAETLAMRLARGSGLQGLAAMAPETEIDGVRLIRPLLGTGRGRLRATLEALGQDWIEDPSNADERHERVRLRRALQPGGGLAAAGLTPRALAASAARLGRAEAAIAHAVARLLGDHARLDRAGYAHMAGEGFAAAPEEIRLRALARLVGRVAGRPAPSGARLEAALRRLDGGAAATTLGGCRIARWRDGLMVTRELRHVAELSLRPGESVLWDGRFRVGLGGETGAVALRPLGAAGFAAARAEVAELAAIPAPAGRALPGGFRGEALVAPPAFSPMAGGAWIGIAFSQEI